MALAYKTRKRLALLTLLVGLPLYVGVVWGLLNWIDDRFGRLPILAEAAIYIGLGLLWALPLRGLFRGIGQSDPADPADPGESTPVETRQAGPKDPPD